MKRNNENAESKNFKLDTMLQVLALLSGEGCSIAGIAAKMNTTERTAYRYLRSLRESGFRIGKEHGNIYLEAVPEHFARITDNVGVTPKEWQLIADAVEATDDPLKEGLMLKIKGQTDKTSSGQTVIRKQENVNIQHLSTAIDGKKQVILHQYSSSNSETISDRRVEPIAFRNGNRCVDCYEISSHRVKTFKIPRIGTVEVTPENWQFEKKHRTEPYDLFGMSSDSLIHVRLRLTIRAANLLKEEFPQSKRLLEPEDSEHFIFDTDVRDVKGIGRFILGLHSEVEIVDAPELEAYLRREAEKLHRKWPIV